MAHESTHSKASEEAMKDNDRHGAGKDAAIPGSESGSHDRSVAAHLEGGKPHTKAAGDLRALEDREEASRKTERATDRSRNG